MLNKDLKQILNQFHYPHQKILEVSEYIYEDAPSERAFLLRGERDVFVLFEIDYVFSIKSVIESINELSSFIQFFPVKKQLTFETSNPVQAATVYKKPSDWKKVQKYAADQKGSPNFYFLALVEPSK